jgi:hypothetical protein
MKKIFIHMFSLVLTIGLFGCGGGGDGSSSSNVIPLKTNNIKQAESGDSWNYNLNGTYSDTSQSFNVSGTLNGQILATTKQSPITLEICLDRYSTGTLTGPGGSITLDSHSYFLQDSNGSIYVYGEGESGSPDTWVVSPVSGYYLEMESPMSIGQSNGASVLFSDGENLTFSYSVDAIENVSTGVGTFEAFRTSQSFSHDFGGGDSTVIVETVWIVPGLGIVKEDADITYYIGGVFDSSLSIISTLNNTTVVY